MTPRQKAYIANRAAGMGQEQAAVAAGYARGSAGVVACRMEKMAKVRGAIDAAREAARPGTVPAEVKYEGAAEYLAAVVRGDAVPDPVRVGAARALLPFERARERSPIKSATPGRLAARAALEEETALADAWKRTAADVRARLKRKK